MKPIGPLSLAVILLAAPIASARTPESLKGLGGLSFKSLGAVKPGRLSRRTVGLSGNVRLSGSTYVGEGTSFVSITFTDWVNITGDQGRVQSGNMQVRVTETFHIDNNVRHLSRFLRPYVYASFYKDGKYIGSAYVSGSIYVSGWVNGNWLRLDGSGTLSGSISIENDAQK